MKLISKDHETDSSKVNIFVNDYPKPIFSASKFSSVVDPEKLRSQIASFDSWFLKNKNQFFEDCINEFPVLFRNAADQSSKIGRKRFCFRFSCYNNVNAKHISDEDRQEAYDRIVSVYGEEMKSMGFSYKFASVLGDIEVDLNGVLSNISKYIS